MKHHSELINYLIEKFKLKSYLEIGTFNLDHNFNKIIVEEKTCVDPDPNAKADYQCTSDTFFENINNLDSDDGGGRKFDIIFIDGLHHADQVKKDIINAFKILVPGGFIMIHDSNPPTEKTTCVPRGSQREWCGDVYKTISQISSPKITVDFDYGCCIINKDTGLEWNDFVIDWDFFNKYRSRLLQLIPVDEYVQMVQKSVEA